jgi:hypothetical protein
MTDIPADIMQAARAAVITDQTPRKLRDLILNGTADEMWPIPHVARAILAERERCARVADERRMWPSFCSLHTVGGVIAAAIRGGSDV